MLKPFMRTAAGGCILLLSGCNFQSPAPTGQETSVADAGHKSPPISEKTTDSKRSPVHEKPLASTRPEAASPVSAVVKADPAEPLAGSTFTLVVEVEIASGWHIYAADRPSGPSLPTKIEVELPKGFEWDDKWTFPDPSLDQSFPGEPSFVHEGRVAFRRKVRVARGIPPGAIAVGGTLYYQACDRFSCRAPARLALRTEIRVVH